MTQDQIKQSVERAIAAGIEAARRAGVQMPDDATKAAIASMSIAPNKNPA